MTAINIISVGVNCPELTSPKASWQTEGTEEIHSFHSLGWDTDFYSSGNQQEGVTVSSILVNVTRRIAYIEMNTLDVKVELGFTPKQNSSVIKQISHSNIFNKYSKLKRHVFKGNSD